MRKPEDGRRTVTGMMIPSEQPPDRSEPGLQLIEEEECERADVEQIKKEFGRMVVHLLNRLKNFFLEKQPTLEMALDKAKRTGWQIEEALDGYIIHGVNADGQPDSWNFGTNQVADMNYLLDHELSVRIGEEYRLQTYGPNEPANVDEASRRRHEIRTYRIHRYDEQEYKPGWKRVLGR